MKVAIIGAGICGLYLAKNLEQKGSEVAVFEKKPVIGKECCSGLFSERLFDHIPEARTLAQNRINRCIIHFPKKDVTLAFKQPFFVLEHLQLDLLAAGLATAAGAGIRLGENINEDRLSEINRQFDRVIGCDGGLSITREYLKCSVSRGLTSREEDRPRETRYTKTQKINFFLGIQGFENKSDNSDFVETWPTRNGFLWRIPRGESVEWGIMEKPDASRRLFDEFILKRNIEIKDLKSAIIPQGLVLSPNEKITLCGDASGLTKPWSGGGVVWGLTQADLLLKYFPNFLEYRNAARRVFKPKIALGKIGLKLASFFGHNLPIVLQNNYKIDSDYLFRI